MEKILGLLFGTSWKSSLVGLVSGVVLAATTYAQSRSEPGWYVVAFALVALGRIVKDWDATGGTKPVTAEAAVRTEFGPK
jgi:hypothetical protein